MESNQFCFWNFFLIVDTSNKISLLCANFVEEKCLKKKATAVKIKSHQNQRSFFQTSKNQQDQKNHFTRCKKSEKIKQNHFSNVKFNKESKVQSSNKILNLVPKVVGMPYLFQTFFRIVYEWLRWMEKNWTWFFQDGESSSKVKKGVFSIVKVGWCLGCHLFVKNILVNICWLFGVLAGNKVKNMVQKSVQIETCWHCFDIINWVVKLGRKIAERCTFWSPIAIKLSYCSSDENRKKKSVSQNC